MSLQEFRGSKNSSFTFIQDLKINTNSCYKFIVVSYFTLIL